MFVNKQYRTLFFSETELRKSQYNSISYVINYVINYSINYVINSTFRKHVQHEITRSCGYA